MATSMTRSNRTGASITESALCQSARRVTYCVGEASSSAKRTRSTLASSNTPCALNASQRNLPCDVRPMPRLRDANWVIAIVLQTLLALSSDANETHPCEPIYACAFFKVHLRRNSSHPTTGCTTPHRSKPDCSHENKNGQHIMNKRISTSNTF